MIRSNFSAKALLLAAAIGLSTAAFAGTQPAAAQAYSDEDNCPVGSVYEPTYGCTMAGADDYGYYGYPYAYEYYGRHHDFDHGYGFGHGMGDGFNHGIGVAHAGGGGFGHGMGGGFGGFHGGGGFGGGGHR
jgi:hypothetical protein